MMPSRIARTTLEPAYETGLGVLRSPEMRLSGAERAVVITPEMRAYFKSRSFLSSPRRRRAHGCTGVSISTLSGSSALTATANSSANAGYAACYLDRLYAAGALHPLSAAQDRQHLPPRRIRSSSHSGKALVDVSSTIRAMNCPDRRRVALSVRSGDSSARRAAARRLAASVRSLRPFVSILVYMPRERSTVIPGGHPRDLADGIQRPSGAFYPFFPEGPLVRIHFIVGRYEGETPNPVAPRLTARSKPSYAAGPTD